MKTIHLIGILIEIMNMIEFSKTKIWKIALSYLLVFLLIFSTFFYFFIPIYFAKNNEINFNKPKISTKYLNYSISNYEGLIDENRFIIIFIYLFLNQISSNPNSVKSLNFKFKFDYNNIYVSTIVNDEIHYNYHFILNKNNI